MAGVLLLSACTSSLGSSTPSPEPAPTGEPPAPTAAARPEERATASDLDEQQAAPTPPPASTPGESSTEPPPAPTQTEAAPPASEPPPPAPTPAEGDDGPSEPPPVLQADPTSLPDIDFSRFRQLLPQDAIRPIYNPTFLTAAESSYRDDELILGLEINGEAKAYSVGFLSFREMVNDELGGVPILVTW